MSEPQRLPAWARHQLVATIFEAAVQLGGEARIVGGAVRNWLADKPITDIDMAVNLPIATVADHLRATTRLTKTRLKVLDTGLAHGTVTISDGRKHIELTQTRDDVDTDGRHAVVRYQPDWTQDAARRDFTINAIYLAANGAIFDPFEGRVDLAASRLRFVGNASDRVQEDALRMLRYCRFLPHYGGGQQDVDALAALRQYAPLAAQLSGERIATELRKILSADNSHIAIELMHDSGLDVVIFGGQFGCERLPFDQKDLSMVVADYGWLVAFAVLLADSKMLAAAQRLRLSRADQAFLQQIAEQAKPHIYANLTAKNWQHSAFFIGDCAAALYACSGWRHGLPFDAVQYRRLRHWQPPEFPLKGADLLSHGVDKGPAVGHMLKAAKALWVQSDFSLSKAALLDAVVNR